jgi:hypothetical protein
MASSFVENGSGKGVPKGQRCCWKRMARRRGGVKSEERDSLPGTIEGTGRKIKRKHFSAGKRQLTNPVKYESFRGNVSPAI